MDILANRALAKLRAGGFAFGTWVQQVRTPALIRWIAAAGFDFVFLDSEHSDLSWETIGTMCDMARASGLVPIVRPYERSGPLSNRIQDIGAMGLMFHDITSRAEVDEIVRWMCYPPRGTRGSSSYGAAMDYTVGPGSEVRRFVDDNAMLVIQIESVEGIAHLDETLTGGGVDVVEIGRGDLSASLSVPLESRHPSVLDAIDQVVSICRRHDVAVGVNASSIEDAADLVERGVRCLSFSNERRILIDSYREAMTGLHALDSSRP